MWYLRSDYQIQIIKRNWEYADYESESENFGSYGTYSMVDIQWSEKFTCFFEYTFFDMISQFFPNRHEYCTIENVIVK